MKEALIIYGGWEDHNPQEVKNFYVKKLGDYNVNILVSNRVDYLLNFENLDMLIFHETMSDEMNDEIIGRIIDLISSGTIMFGMHNGILDAFRNSQVFQSLAGGQFINHYGGSLVTFRVYNDDTIIFGDITDFEYTSEQYYMLVDPAVDILMYTYVSKDHMGYFNNNKDKIKMPIVMKRTFGKGEILSCSLGHAIEEFELPIINQIIDCVFSHYLGERKV